MADPIDPGRHVSSDLKEIRRWTETSLSYTFSPNFHPYAPELLERLIAGSVQGLQDADTEPAVPPANLPGGRPRPKLYRELFSDSGAYQPTELVPKRSWPVAELDFTPGGAYAVYNWELFFHIPVTIAVHLSRNGRYAEAQRWFHHVFDPTTEESGATPERFWKTAPFRTTDVDSIEDLLTNLSSEAVPELREQTMNSITAWQRDPFRPHLVARLRPSAYMIYTLMAYLDNLVAWGDALFAQDTGESVAEATQLYILAANLLGPRPQAVPTKGTTATQTYATLKKNRLDPFSNALVKLETSIPFDLSPPGAASAPADGGPLRFGALGQTLYFCVPRNDKVIGYWDTVADRLFKIRNSLSLAGAFRQLPTFDPPIDPALLARATAAGVDVAAVVAGVNQPAPLVRFGVLVAKAGELCQEVKSLGGALLSAVEKQDGEALAALRARHETAALELAKSVRYAQWQEAVKNREALGISLVIARTRYAYYERLLGRSESEITFEDVGELDSASMDGGSFTGTEPAVGPRTIAVDIAESAIPAGGGPAAGAKISSYEAKELDFLEYSQILQDVAAGLETYGGILSLFPMLSADGKPVGVGAGVTFGGTNLSGLLSGLAGAARGVASRVTHEAARAAKVGGYVRREQDWAFQSNSAAGDITQLNKQLRASQIREFMAQREVQNHDKQIAKAKEIETFLAGEKPAGRTTTTAYYALLRREVRGLYNQCYELALDTARKAERALRNELGNPGLTFVRPSYLAGPEGLLAGEKLHLDIRRMEIAQLDLNRREYELTKHISLLQADPWALVALRATGRCTFTVPEELLDLDTPGHYFRRIRSVSLSVPCVTGPYTGVACTVRLLRSRVRTSPLLKDGEYAPVADGEDRFEDQLGATEAVVTSTGNNDSGLFDPGAGDGRLLPFEYRGVVSEWQLELPDGPRPFDYDTITDIILHVRYTAREGGQALRDRAGAHLRDLLAEGTAAGSVRLLSVRHEFPTAWARFVGSKAGNGSSQQRPRAELKLPLRAEHYPFFAGSGPAGLTSVALVARPAGAEQQLVLADRAWDRENPNDEEDKKTGAVKLTGRPELNGLLRGALRADPAIPGKRAWGDLPEPVGSFSLYAENNAMKDLFVLLTWSAKDPAP
ncbi:insecticidal toxin protein [Streptomyces sp. A7024]|uniref:Insecticidal toxin protein n=1 Tax=Streptomyces coryli TaxID=1128680 RepID=A0A6G4U5F8_9ACTN|nr:insecticidal toxin protein [Streptomyces coryli]NGN66618.1 insecticidal toxin protein [Streptomyces coryli]